MERLFINIVPHQSRDVISKTVITRDVISKNVITRDVISKTVISSGARNLKVPEPVPSERRNLLRLLEMIKYGFREMKEYH